MRTDIHRPSAINPEDYQYVCFKYIGGNFDMEMCSAVLASRKVFEAHKAAHPGADYARTEHRGSCYVCGAGALSLIIWYHAATNSYIQTGEDCARKMDMSAPDMNAFRRAVADAREAQAGKRKAIAILADLGLMAAWDIYSAEPIKHAAECALNFDQEYAPVKCTCGTVDNRNEFPERTINDIVGKLVRYGNISPNQSAFVLNLLKQIEDRPLVLAQRQAEKDAAGPVPVGRVELVGEVVGMKEVDVRAFHYNAPTTQTKLIIRLENGSKVYGNRFANLEKGSKVRFIASVEASKDDAKFGFFKRAALYQSKEQKLAIKKLSHAYESQRTIQVSQMSEVNDAEGINQACETLHRLWMNVLAEVGDPTGKYETERYAATVIS